MSKVAARPLQGRGTRRVSTAAKDGMPGSVVSDRDKRRPRTDRAATDLRATHPLATKDGIEAFVGLLVFMGAMCPKCGYGTRAAGKRWAKCKRCGERVERRALPSPQPGNPDGRT